MISIITRMLIPVQLWQMRESRAGDGEEAVAAAAAVLEQRRFHLSVSQVSVIFFFSLQNDQNLTGLMCIYARRRERK